MIESGQNNLFDLNCTTFNFWRTSRRERALLLPFLVQGGLSFRGGPVPSRPSVFGILSERGQTKYATSFIMCLSGLVLHMNVLISPVNSRFHAVKWVA